jgi:hypothetical protein
MSRKLVALALGELKENMFKINSLRGIKSKRKPLISND